MEYMWIIWLVIFVLALLIEAIGPEIVSVWFAGGAVVSLIISFIPGVEWWVQLIVFAVVSAALLVFCRPFLAKVLKRDTIDLNADTMVGKKGVITSEVKETKSGEVVIDGVIWTAIATKDDMAIGKDSLVKVMAVSGNKLIVMPVNSKEEK
ncbi:MAG: NfeD family protein [Bacilli bacterium]|nr:NfeD family protein [Bacilli bacterium]